MRRLLPIPLFAVPLIILILAVCAGPPSNADEPSPSPASTVTEAPSPTPVERFATPTPSAEPYPPPSSPTPPAHTASLQPGDWAQLSGTDACLNIRAQPGIAKTPEGTEIPNQLLNCLPDGFIGMLSYDGYFSGVPGPVQADGHWWWNIVGQGWAAQDWLAFYHDAQLPYPARPDLAGAGLIAYLSSDSKNGGDIWVMNADGSNPHRLIARADEREWFSDPAWSPDGTRFSITVRGGKDNPGFTAIRVVDLSGNLDLELAGLTGARWSPEGTRLSALQVVQTPNAGFSMTPIVYNLITGDQTVLGPTNSYFAAPAWSADGNSLAFTCLSYTVSTPLLNGTVQESRVDCAGDGVRIVSADGASTRVILAYTNESGVRYGAPSGPPTAPASLSSATLAAAAA